MSEKSILVRDKVLTRQIEPGVIEIVFKSGKTIEPDDIVELRKVDLDIMQNNNYVVLVQAEELVNFTKETRELLASKEFQGRTLAKALLIDGLGQKIMGNFYLHVNKPHIKTKLFTSRSKALIWLRGELRNK